MQVFASRYNTHMYQFIVPRVLHFCTSLSLLFGICSASPLKKSGLCSGALVGSLSQVNASGRQINTITFQYSTCLSSKWCRYLQAKAVHIHWKRASPAVGWWWHWVALPHLYHWSFHKVHSKCTLHRQRQRQLYISSRKWAGQYSLRNICRWAISKASYYQTLPLCSKSPWVWSIHNEFCDCQYWAGTSIQVSYTKRREIWVWIALWRNSLFPFFIESNYQALKREVGL